MTRARGQTRRFFLWGVSIRNPLRSNNTSTAVRIPVFLQPAFIHVCCCGGFTKRQQQQAKVPEVQISYTRYIIPDVRVARLPSCVSTSVQAKSFFANKVEWSAIERRTHIPFGVAGRTCCSFYFIFLLTWYVYTRGRIIRTGHSTVVLLRDV